MSDGLRLRIHGKVQGVFYRAWTAELAGRLGLTGWVRNRVDGSVEAEAWGARPALSAFLEACRSGPPAARVDRIDQEELTGDAPARFQKRATV